MLFSIALSIACQINANEVTGISIPDELYELDRLHHAFSDSLHQKLIKTKLFNLKKVKTVKQLEFLVKQHIKNNQKIKAVNLIIMHIPMLKNNYDNLAIFDFISILLEQNELTAATRLFNILKNEGDRTLYSNAAFYFTKHHFKRQQWDKVLSFLDDTINDLPPNDHHHALLMKGISLQHQLKHREAIKTYEKIPASSTVYIPARLNMATANIRQGWWTDAHTIINAVLTDNSSVKNEESINRLYLTLGYSFLYKEYYRNSRDAFRNVGLKSRYTNQALLGLALSAANQEDYIGALNATRILKKNKSRDLITDESYFLMPYLYEKLQQNTTASAGYSEAITYYDNRITQINEIIHANNDLYKYALTADQRGNIRIDKMNLDLSGHYPVYVLTNYTNLDSYSDTLEKLDDKSITAKYNDLYNKYASVIRRMVTTILQNRIKYLNSYKDQSRYGLARLYDNNLTASK